MRELRPGLWHWHAPHPEWASGLELARHSQRVEQQQPLTVVDPLGRDVRVPRLGRRPLLALPVEHVLPTHGGPTDRGALERVLSPS